MSVSVCTIVARNYLPHARVLAKSFRSNHPDGRMVVLVFDDLQREVDPAVEPFEIYRLDDLGMDVSEFHRMAMIYDIMEFATSLKPWLLEAILDSGVSHVLYLDPDIEVFDSLDRLAETGGRTRNRLDPARHRTLSARRNDDRRERNFVCRDLQLGIYRGWPGLAPIPLLLAGTAATRMHQRSASGAIRRPALGGLCARECSTALSFETLSTTSHIGTSTPGSFRWTGERYEVDGRPLAFFHFQRLLAGRSSPLEQASGFQSPDPAERALRHCAYLR